MGALGDTDLPAGALRRMGALGDTELPAGAWKICSEAASASESEPEPESVSESEPPQRSDLNPRASCLTIVGTSAWMPKLYSCRHVDLNARVPRPETSGAPGAYEPSRPPPRTRCAYSANQESICIDH
eukprot:366568-Chlamydomonas_euryale.AAC.11